MLRKYPAQIVSITNPISDVYTIEFKSTGKPFKYDPGQFLHLAIDEYDPAGQWPDSRCFSMQSSPDEELIKITYAVKGQFTTRMHQELKPGSEVTLKLPYGDLFTQPHNKTNTVFIAGGTGITPFLSLFTHESFNEYINPQIYLGFRSKEYNIYHDQFERMNQIRAIRDQFVPIRVFYQDTDGILDIAKIFNTSNPDASFFISGPPAMIKTFKQSLISNGISTSQVLTDDWE